MKNKTLAAKTAKSIIVLLFIIIVSLNGAFAQETKEVYYQRQIAELTKKISASPKDDKLFVLRGKAYLELDKTAEAIDDALTAISLNSESNEAHGLLEDAQYKKTLNEMWEQPVQKKDAGNATINNKSANSNKADNVIIPGIGAGKIVLGIKRSEVEAILGTADEFLDVKTDLFPIYEAHYYSKGIQIEYDPDTQAATNIAFVGNTDGSSFKKYKMFNGVTDTEIKWGASPAEVIKVYGKPQAEEFNALAPARTQHNWIRYRGVEFSFQNNKLFLISNNSVYGLK